MLLRRSVLANVAYPLAIADLPRAERLIRAQAALELVGLAPLAHIPTLVLGVQSDILFTVEQQREVADALRMGGNEQVSYYELGGVWGHDTFL